MSSEYEKEIIEERCLRCGRDLSGDSSAMCPSCGTVRLSTDASKAQLNQ